MSNYCCEEFTKIVEKPESESYRHTTFSKQDGLWWTDFSDGEYGDIKLSFCPFCGTKLLNAKHNMENVKNG